MGYIAGIGGANMDIHGISDHPLVMRDSNPGRLHMSLGGVCRNICENLARLGADVRLVTVVGNDVNGRSIIDGCEAVGIDMREARVLYGERSSTYVSIMDEDGDMLMAMSDMHIIKRLDAALVDDAKETLCGADIVVCDGNLSTDTIARLVETVKTPLYLDPVSTAWAKELKPWIGSFHTVKPNRMELEALSDHPVSTMEDVKEACQLLREKGVVRLFVSLGRDGMFYSGPEGEMHVVGRPYAHMVNATGAGDAAMAGIVRASQQGLGALETVHTAMACGMIAIASEDTISSEMCPAAVQQTIKEYIK